LLGVDYQDHLSHLKPIGTMPGVSSASFALEVVESASRFEQLAESWEELAASEPTPFCSHAWFNAWWKAFGKGSQLCTLLLWEGAELVAAYPLYVHEGRHRSMANVHSPLFRPLARDDAALREITTATLRFAPQQLVVEPLPEEDAALGAFERAVVEAGGHTLRSQCHVSPIVDTVGDFAAWRAESRPRWGAPLERFRRKMLRENAAEIRVIATPEDLEAELDRGFAVEASGWKGRAGTAILSSANTERFYREVARAASARGELRLSTIVLDGEVAAFDLTLLRANRLYLLKTGFDERQRRLAPGLVLRLSVIEHCFELGLVAHDLLGNDSEWKRKFATSSRSHVSVEVYGKSPLQLANYAWRHSVRPALAHARAGARQLARRSPPPSPAPGEH
jgi:CelD/BcsL family acetyltransferase involved in cellulose biosynthesis